MQRPLAKEAYLIHVGERPISERRQRFVAVSSEHISYREVRLSH